MSRLDELDALSRQRVLTHAESLALEREIHRQAGPNTARLDGRESPPKVSRSRTAFEQKKDRERELRALQNELVEELVGRGASPVLVHYVLTVLLAQDLNRRQIAQRIRHYKERIARQAEQAKAKPELLSRCVNSYGAVCAYCDREGTSESDPDGKKWELDRIFPGWAGGEYEPLNVALCCHKCNQKKGGNITFCPPPSLSQLEAA